LTSIPPKAALLRSRGEALGRSVGTSYSPVTLIASAARLTARLMKVAYVPEERQIATMELALYRAMWSEWQEKANTAIAIATATISSSGTVTKEKAETARDRLIEGFKNWPSKRLSALMESTVSQTYRLSEQALLRKAAGKPGYKNASLVAKAIGTAQLKPSFNTMDEEAVAWLKESQVFWLGEHFDPITVQLIRDYSMTELEGLPGKEAGAKLRDVAEAMYGVGAFADRGQWYFQGTAVNASTTARVTGTIRQMQKIGVTRYEIVNPMDERTTEICRDMNGKVMEVSAAAGVLDDLMKAKDPGAIKDIHGWDPRGYKDQFDKIGIDITAGSPFPTGKDKDIAKLGFALPPYHFMCRTTVDISTDAVFVSTGETPEGASGTVLPEKPKKPKKPKIPKEQKPTGPEPKHYSKTRKHANPYAISYLAETKGIAPTGPFDEKRLRDTLPSTRAGKAKKSDQRVLRQELNNLLAEWGITSYDLNVNRPDSGTFRFGRSLGAAHHTWEGGIVVNTQYSFGLWSYQGGDTSTNTLRTSLGYLIHEAVHGASKEFATAYTGTGRWIEEVTTEVVARRILSELYPARFSFSDGTAYQPPILKMADAMTEYYRLQGFAFPGGTGTSTSPRWGTGQTAIDVICEAGLNLRRSPVSGRAVTVTTSDELVDAFVASVDLPEGLEGVKADRFRDGLKMVLRREFHNYKM